MDEYLLLFIAITNIFILLYRQLKKEAKGSCLPFDVWRLTTVWRLPFAVYPARKIEGDSARRVFAVWKSCLILLIRKPDYREAKSRDTGADKSREGLDKKTPCSRTLIFNSQPLPLVPLCSSLTRYVFLVFLSSTDGNTDANRAIDRFVTPCWETAVWRTNSEGYGVIKEHYES